MQHPGTPGTEQPPDHGTAKQVAVPGPAVLHTLSKKSMENLYE